MYLVASRCVGAAQGVIFTWGRLHYHPAGVGVSAARNKTTDAKKSQHAMYAPGAHRSQHNEDEKVRLVHVVRISFASRGFICACLGSGNGLLLPLSRDEGSPEAAVWAERLAARGGVGLAPARVEGTPAVGHHLGAQCVRLGRHLRGEVDLARVRARARARVRARARARVRVRIRFRVRFRVS